MTDRGELEKIILGTILLDQKSFDEISGFINEDAFSESVNREIFKAIVKMYNGGEQIDLLTICAKLRTMKRLEYVGGASYVSGLTHRVASSVHLEYHSRILMQYYYRDQITLSATEMMRLANDPELDVFEALAMAKNSLSNLDSVTDITKERDKTEVIAELMNDIERASKTGLAGISTGIYELDDQLGGLESGMIIMAGRPGSGKTALAVSMSAKMSIKNELKGIYFSLEMPAKQLFRRYIAIDGDIRSYNLRSGDMSSNDWELFGKSSDRIIRSNFEVYDKYHRLDEILSKCRQLHRVGNLDYMIVDYLQLVKTNSKGNREQEVATIARSFKELSMQLDIPVIALSQLSRKCEERADKKPMLSDLRESGAIEQDADTVLFMYRPSYYGIRGESGEDLSDKAYVILGKHRNGDLSDIELHYKHSHNQEWGTMQSKKEYDSFVVDEFQQSAMKPNEAF
jgi:replicative DNA helicase